MMILTPPHGTQYFIQLTVIVFLGHNQPVKKSRKKCVILLLFEHKKVKMTFINYTLYACLMLQFYLVSLQDIYKMLSTLYICFV